MKRILFLAIMFVSVQIFSQTTYNSATDGNWNSQFSWSPNGIPGSDDTAVIAHNITVTDAQECATLDVNFAFGKKLTIDGSGASLTVSGTTTNDGEILVTGGSAANPATLTLNGNLTNSAPLTINDGQRLIMGTNAGITADDPITIKSDSNSHGSIYIYDGTWTATSNSGVISYNRHISNLSTWDLISVPVSTLSINDFATGETDLATNGIQYAIGTYTNTTAAYNAGNTWQNYTQTTAPTAGNFVSGKGYQMAAKGSASGTGVGAEMTFSGLPNTGTITIPIINSETGVSNEPSDGSRFNLVGNPYPSFISVSAFLSANSSVLGSGFDVYGWNGSSYDTYNSASNNPYIAPGQGFMVGADSSNSATLGFTTSMQSTSNTSMDDFISGDQLEDRAELFLGYSNSDYSNKAEIYFLENTSDSFDTSYDSVTIDFDYNNGIHTRLVDSSSDNRNFVIQSLSYSEMNDKVIPLVIHGTANEELTVNILHRTTPADINIFLEDTFLNTFTNLKEEDFILTPTADLSGAGRFYVHLTEDTMSTIDVSSNMINAFKDANSDFITVEGLSSQESLVNVSLFNILGSKVLSTSFDNSLNKRVISTQGISQGIYVIELESSGNRVTKKILIK